jgi:lipopolysaccharide biosynthesis regulator YciM
MSPATFIGKLLLFGGAMVFGWYAGRRWRIGGTPQPRPASREYLAGLNFLVQDQPDRALEAFLRAVEVDRETVEMHLALGALYRRRGEIDRAIRVHQNLISREDLDARQREQATYALAQDYLKAGLHDRAEKLLQPLSGGGTFRLAALKDLIRLYELQRDWGRATETGQAMSRIGRPASESAQAHYACELATAALAGGSVDAAREHLRLAKTVTKRFPRAALLRADIAILDGDAVEAMDWLSRVLEQQPDLAPEVLPRVRRAFDAGAAPALVLDWLQKATPELRAHVVQATLLGDFLDMPMLRELTRTHLLERPGIGEVLRASLPTGQGLDDERLDAVCAALRKQARRSARYRCQQCGFSSTAFFWQCPGCKTWDGLKPLTEIDVLLPAPQ